MTFEFTLEAFILLMLGQSFISMGIFELLSKWSRDTLINKKLALSSIAVGFALFLASFV